MVKKQKRRKRRIKKKVKKKILKFILGIFIILSIIYIFKAKMRETIDDKNIEDSITVGVDKNTESSINNSEEHKEAFSKDLQQGTNLQYLMLINKNNEIAPDYEPNDLVIPSIRFGNIGNMMVQYVRTDVAVALEQLFKAAKNEGINLIAISGYRSYEYQDNLYDNEVNNVGEIQANRYVAKPGQSEHQTGLAMDILSNDYMELDQGFEDTEAFNWLEKNMSKFGFILRYPKGKENITGYGYEPWHIRYVGVEVATEIMEDGITLEEYLDK